MRMTVTKNLSSWRKTPL